MKRKLTKLRLKSEIVRTLTKESLSIVAGGANAISNGSDEGCPGVDLATNKRG